MPSHFFVGVTSGLVITPPRGRRTTRPKLPTAPRPLSHRVPSIPAGFDSESLSAHSSSRSQRASVASPLVSEGVWTKVAGIDDLDVSWERARESLLGKVVEELGSEGLRGC
jgi:hypothetical protein